MFIKDQANKKQFLGRRAKDISEYLNKGPAGGRLACGDADRTHVKHELVAQNLVEEAIELDCDFLWTDQGDFEMILKGTPDQLGRTHVETPCPYGL